MPVGRRAQVWRHQPEFRRPRHFHEEPELNLVVTGKCLVGVGDRVLRVSAGELLFFHAGQDHVLLEASEDLDLFVLAVRPELAARVSVPRALKAAGANCRLSSAELSAVTAELAGLRDVRDHTPIELCIAELFAKTGARFSSAHVLRRPRATTQTFFAPRYVPA